MALTMHLRISTIVKIWIPKLVVMVVLVACQQHAEQEGMVQNAFAQTSIVILGNTQDAGSPQLACNKSCCANVDETRMVSSIGLIDPKHHRSVIIDASPDFTAQSKILQDHSSYPNFGVPDAIFLTHAHIGHYTGLMYLGKEAMASDSLPVFCMPRMHAFLSRNGPWDLLVKDGRINLQQLVNKSFVPISDQLSIAPILVPHRDEYSETVGYLIKGPNKTALYIPDID